MTLIWKSKIGILIFGQRLTIMALVLGRHRVDKVLKLSYCYLLCSFNPNSSAL
jgi:hypothetical protein